MSSLSRSARYLRPVSLTSRAVSAPGGARERPARERRERERRVRLGKSWNSINTGFMVVLRDLNGICINGTIVGCIQVLTIFGIKHWLILVNTG